MSALPAETAVRQAKALLLCRHAEDLSTQCASAIRGGALEPFRELQARKQVIIQELAAVSTGLEIARDSELQVAIDQLRTALQAELGLVQTETEVLQEKLSIVRNSQKRLTPARHYGTGASLLAPSAGNQFSVRG